MLSIAEVPKDSWIPVTGTGTGTCRFPGLSILSREYISIYFKHPPKNAKMARKFFYKFLINYKNKININYADQV